MVTLMQDRHSYANAVQSELAALQATVDRLESRLSDQGPLRHMREDLFLTNRDAQAKLEMLRSADGEHWESFSVMVDAAVNSLRSAVNRVATTVPESDL